VPNEPLRRAIRASGLTLAQLAERLQVDHKTVERWISPGRTPHPRHRQTLAAILDVPESELWLPSRADQQASGAPSIDDLLGRIGTLEGERRQYEQALWRLAEHSVGHTRVTSRVITYQIGETMQGDRASDTWQIEAMDPSHGIAWWLIAIGASGRGVPQKSTARQLERLEAEEVLDEGRTRGVPILHLDHRGGKNWAIAIFDGDLPRRALRVSWSWPGVWNMLRAELHDRVWLDLREMLHVDLELLSVTFRFPATALAPEARVGAGVPSLLPTVARDGLGRVTYTFDIDAPARRLYTWDLEVEGLRPIGAG
jgi:transcriptional regulator with XRE-family HTH domain